jgi:hypothetical protein
MQAFYRAVATALLGTIAGLGVEAAEYCVTCADPEAQYACTFDGASQGPGDAGLKLYCITELAKSGQHGSCSVDRAQSKPCAGKIVQLAGPDATQPLPSPPANATAGTGTPTGTPATPPAKDPSKASGTTTLPKSDAPPKTVEEMVKKGTADASDTLEKSGDTAVEAAKTTGSVLQNAGKSVGDAAKKTWNCITSLFGNC